MMGSMFPRMITLHNNMELMALTTSISMAPTMDFLMPNWFLRQW